MNRIIIVMGVSGSGKTTVGAILAEKLGLTFHDADDFHSPANKKKMASGIPLDDNDRAPWLESLSIFLQASSKAGRGVVLACSALRETGRKTLTANITDPVFIYLKVDKDIVTGRHSQRKGHFMNPSLIESQFLALEEPVGENVMVMNGAEDPTTIARLVAASLNSKKPPSGS